MLKILKAIFALPFALPMTIGMLLTMLLAGRIARTDRKRAAWLLLRLATFTNRMPASKPESKRQSLAIFVAPALLLQGAPWQRVRRWGELSPSTTPIAFAFYFAEQRFDQALEAAQSWCEQTEAAVVGREAEMRAFFARYGADLSPQSRGEIMSEARQHELDAWEADPQGKRPNFFELFRRATPHYEPFLRYYDAHLALRAARWIETRNLNSKSLTKEFARQSKSEGYMGLPQFKINEDSLLRLGMNPTKLAVARRRAMGEL